MDHVDDPLPEQYNAVLVYYIVGEFKYDPNLYIQCADLSSIRGQTGIINAQLCIIVDDRHYIPLTMYKLLPLS